MPKDDDRHLTTTQLSALIDKQLSEQELAVCNAHLETCHQCQSTLAGLQQTVALLQALPEPALPRSFVLPTGVTYLQERAARPGQGEQQAGANPPVRQRLWAYYVQRSLRVASTIAAVIGLVFLLSGILPTLPHGGGASTGTSAPAASSQQRTSSPASATTGTNNAATATAEKANSANQHGTAVHTPIASPQPAKTPAAVTSKPKSNLQQKPSTNTQAQPPLPLSDLGTPLGRQLTGFTLLVLGIVGILLTRRKQKERENQH